MAGDFQISGHPAKLGGVSDLLQPGMVTIVLRTPLGVYFLDPFAPPDPTVDKIVKMLGIEIELRPGGPTPEDLAAPKLSTGIIGLGLLAGYIAFRAWKG